MHLRQNRRSAFAVIELVVVILILGILAGVLVPRVTDRLAAARDSRRFTDLRIVRNAIEQYFLDKGAYPPPSLAKVGDGYDLSNDGDFIPELVKTGYLREPVKDPINNAKYSYGYNVFPQGSCGCKGKGTFYVLGLRQFETATFAADHPGFFKCTQKDWSTDFEFVTGGGTSEKVPPTATRAGTK